MLQYGKVAVKNTWVLRYCGYIDSEMMGLNLLFYYKVSLCLNCRPDPTLGVLLSWLELQPKPEVREMTNVTLASKRQRLCVQPRLLAFLRALAFSAASHERENHT